MECESYNLNWAEFESYTSLTFKELLNKQDFTDVTLACEDEEHIQAHKVILSACSPFFSRILKKNTHNHPLIYLTDVTLNDLKAIINFMYLGQTNVAQENLQRFLKVATKFEVRGLTEKNKGKVDGVSNGSCFSRKEDEEEEEEEDIHNMLEDEVMIDESLLGVPLLDVNDGAIHDGKDATTGGLCIKGEEEDGNSVFFSSQQNVFNRSFDMNIGPLPRPVMVDNENKYPCDQCDYKASYACNLTSHKRTVHEKLFFYCTLCDYKSSRKDRLNKHILVKHGDQH